MGGGSGVFGCIGGGGGIGVGVGAEHPARNAVKNPIAMNLEVTDKAFMDNSFLCVKKSAIRLFCS
jgi:hypothetical protein